ncbi:MAG: GNAT family N-acetyltransferase, partial [Gammaproteobacteria bacterium]
MRRPRRGAAAGTPALRTSGRWARLPAIHALRRSAGPLGSANVSRGRTGVRPKPSRRSTVLHHHYAFDNTGPRGSCKRFARRGPNGKRPMTQLTTRRLRLRQWRAADLESFASLNADPVVMELMPRCLTRAESDELALSAAAEIEQRGWGLWAVQLREGGDFLGAAGLCVPSFEAHFTPCVEIDWRLKRPSWGH